MSRPPQYRVPVLLSLLCGLGLRVLTPAGYMPASAGSGLLFELCPDSLPPGVTLTRSSDAHPAHHHHGGDERKGDQCDLGHMLTVASVDAPIVEAMTADVPATVPAPVPPRMPAAVPRRLYWSRAPPTP